MRLTSVAVFVLAFLAATASGRPDPEPPAPAKVPERVKKDLGEQAVAILSGATRVEVFRLEKEKLKAGQAAPVIIGADRLRWRVTATGKEQGDKFAAKVRDLLFDEATRTLSGAGGFRGDVAFRVRKGKESVTVVVDFDGSQFLVVARDADGKEGRVAAGGFLFDAKGGFDKGGLFARVKALAVEAFPDDKALKALKKVEIKLVDPLRPIKP